MVDRRAVRSRAPYPARGPARGRGPAVGPPAALGDGTSWPIALAASTVICTLLAVATLHRTGLIGGVFPVGLVVASLAATLLVRPRDAMAAGVAPPLVALVAVTVTWLVGSGGGGITAFLLGVLAPLAELFWWLVVATAGSLLVVLLRRRRGER